MILKLLIINNFSLLVDRTCNEVAVAPMTPNLRMQRRREAAASAAANARRLQPPPSPTHKLHQLSSRSGGSAMIQRQLMADDVIRFELNSQQETERIVLASPSILVPLPLRRWRSLSTGQLTVKVSPGRRRKSRSLDSSPVQQVNNRCRLPGVRRYFFFFFLLKSFKSIAIYLNRLDHGPFNSAKPRQQRKG